MCISFVQRRPLYIVQMLYKCFVFTGKLFLKSSWNVLVGSFRFIPTLVITNRPTNFSGSHIICGAGALVQWLKKLNESGFRPPLCTYRLNWARRTSWGWWDDWDDTVLQTQDSKFEPWRSEAEHATSRSRRLPTILTFTRGWGRNNFVSFKPPRPGTEPRTLAWKAAVLTTTLGPPPGAVVKAACLESRRSRARAPLWPSSFKEKKCFFPAHS